MTVGTFPDVSLKASLGVCLGISLIFPPEISSTATVISYSYPRIYFRRFFFCFLVFLVKILLFLSRYFPRMLHKVPCRISTGVHAKIYFGLLQLFLARFLSISFSELLSEPIMEFAADSILDYCQSSSWFFFFAILEISNWISPGMSSRCSSGILHLALNMYVHVPSEFSQGVLPGFPGLLYISLSILVQSSSRKSSRWSSRDFCRSFFWDFTYILHEISEGVPPWIYPEVFPVNSSGVSLTDSCEIPAVKSSWAFRCFLEEFFQRSGVSHAVFPRFLTEVFLELFPNFILEVPAEIFLQIS